MAGRWASLLNTFTPVRRKVSHFRNSETTDTPKKRASLTASEDRFLTVPRWPFTYDACTHVQ